MTISTSTIVGLPLFQMIQATNTLRPTTTSFAKTRTRFTSVPTLPRNLMLGNCGSLPVWTSPRYPTVLQPRMWKEVLLLRDQMCSWLMDRRAPSFILVCVQRKWQGMSLWHWLCLQVRFIEDQVHGVTGSGVGAYVVIPGVGYEVFRVSMLRMANVDIFFPDFFRRSLLQR